MALAYAFEQSGGAGGARRRPPSTTPPLVNGQPPTTVAFTVAAQATPAVARASFTYDPLRSELAWDLRISGVPADRVQAAVLLRRDSTSARVIQRLSGPGATRATGKAYLNGIDRRALLDGRLVLSLLTRDGRSAAQDGRLEMPR